MELPTDPILEPVAKTIVEHSLEIKTGDKLLILMHPSAWQLGNMVKSSAETKGAEVRIRFRSPEVSKFVLEGLNNSEQPISLPKSAENLDIKPEDQVTAFIHHGMGDDMVRDAAWATKYLSIRNKIPADMQFNIDPAHQETFDKVDAVLTRFRNDDPNKTWTLIYEPDEKEATTAGMTLAEYRKLYYEAINRDWNEVEKAQQVLIDYLVDKKIFSVQCPSPEGFPADWDTDVAMSIEGMKPRNSTIKNNLPGSEIFTAPAKDTITGRYSLTYPVMFGQRILPNLKIEFERGEVVSFDVFYANAEDSRKKADLEYVSSLLKRDAGANKVGELGIGTNPLINKPYLNTLLIEKVGGSIHLAIGNSYVNMVDGEVIQKDGKFLLEGLEVLNRDN